MAAKKPGKLKIFIGYAPGVGKTCAMLNAAHEEQKAGVDVVAGYIDPHARPDTAALLKGLEMLPHARDSKSGSDFNEFELDHALQRNPELILVDDLAHSNAEGSRHKKRYQDVAELIRAGIDVYSTIDVQQIESLADIVSAMIGRTVQDRIPDNVLDRADQVQLVDVDPDQLMGRWRSGKLFPDQGTQSTYGYLFNIVKLNALRELAVVKIADLLKRKAVQIGGQVKNSENTVKEHILVCLSSAPSNKKVIRTAMLLTGFLPISQGLFSKHASGVPSGRWCQEQYVPDQSQEHPLQQAYTCFQAVMRQKRILRFQEL